jgi:transglutaminase-like putative cysteine protease
MSPRRPLPPRYYGPRWFGPAYARMMARDPHAPGSIDRRLLRAMIGLDARSAPYLYHDYTPTGSPYRRGARPALERLARRLTDAHRSPEAKISAIARWSGRRAENSSTPLEDLRFGGTEEEIVRRGSDWCTDLARVDAALFQVLGLPARIVCLADIGAAYRGHAIVEVYRGGRWGAVDAVRGTVYRTPDGTPATAWDLMRHPARIRASRSRPDEGRARRGEFRRAAVVNYAVGSTPGAQYRVRRIGPYYRSILRESERGWPGGLRWLHGEGRNDPENGDRAARRRARARASGPRRSSAARAPRRGSQRSRPSPGSRRTPS